MWAHDYFNFEELSSCKQSDLLWLKEDVFASFCQGEPVAVTAAHRQHVIVLPVEKEPRFLEFNAEGDINWLINTARFGYIADDGMVRPICNGRTVREILEDAAPMLLAQIPIVSLDSLANHQNPWHVWHDSPTDAFLKAVTSKSDFTGMATTCDCGIPGCSAEYVWLKDQLCFLYIRVLAVGWKRIEFLPFRIDHNLSAEAPNFVRKPTNVHVPSPTRPLPLPG